VVPTRTRSLNDQPKQARRRCEKPKAQRNFTDPESKIMKTADGSFHQCFNAQAVVDAEHQVIVAADLNDCAADVANLIGVDRTSRRQHRPNTHADAR
jgi:hypothetical protein